MRKQHEEGRDMKKYEAWGGGMGYEVGTRERRMEEAGGGMRYVKAGCMQIVKNDLMLKMTPENKSKTFHNKSKLDLLLNTLRTIESK